jgi:hypothetical protein
MPITANILERKTSHFVLWRPQTTATAPQLVIGQLQPGNPPTLQGQQQFPLTAVVGAPDLWEIAAAKCQLQNGQVYHYWFDVDDTQSSQQPPPRIRCTDPMAFAVDWRLFPPGTTDGKQPADFIGREPIFPWEAKVYTLS